MTNIGFELTTSDELAVLAQELREFAPKLYRTIARDVLPEIDRNLARTVDSRLRAQPGAVSRPFVWSLDPIKNARGRRGFFARYPNGFRRTGALVRDWYNDIIFNDGIVSVTVGNDNPGASFTYGSEQYNFVQVPGHDRTGWLNAGQVVPDIVIETTIEVERGIEQAVDLTMRRIFG